MPSTSRVRIEIKRLRGVTEWLLVIVLVDEKEVERILGPRRITTIKPGLSKKSQKLKPLKALKMIDGTQGSVK